MKLTNYEWWRTGRLGTLCWIVMGLAGMTLALTTHAQGVSTTTVQGTVYLANGQPGAGTLVVSWPAFTTAAGQAIAADSLTYSIPADGFVSVNLAPNVGALPAGEYYTALYYMSDGTVSTQYWQVPAAASASLAQVQVQVMPAAQAVQAVSKAYVDQAIAQISGSGLSAGGGTLTAPLYLNADPTQPLQAATKHYVDTQVATDVPLAGGNMTGALGTPAVNGVEAPAAGSAQTTLQAAMTTAGTNGAMQIPPTYAGTDTFTNPNGVKVTDLRTGVAQQTERSVKEFGAACDGATDDTNALQAALNYADTHNVALTIPEGTCKTRTLNWHGESIGGLGKQVSALMGFPGQDVLATTADSTNLLQYTRLHDLTIYVDQSVDVSCTAAKGRAAAGSCQVSRPMEANSIFSPGGNGLTGTAGTGAAWSVGNCAIAMPAATGAGGNGLRVAEIENLEIATTGADPMAQYAGAHSTHTCGLYLAQWPQWSEFRNIDIRGLNTGVAIPELPVATPAGLTADSNRWQNVTIQATHAFTAAAGSNNVLDNVVAAPGNSSATGEPPTGLVLDLAGTLQGWTARNAVVSPAWNAVQPALTVTATGGAVTAVTMGTEHGLGWDPYGTSVPLAFSGSCSAQGTATVSSNGSISAVNVTAGGVGCSSTTTASVNAAGTWDTDAPVNLIGGQDMTFFAGNLLKGNGGYTVWNAASSASYGTQLDGGGGTLPGGGSYTALVANSQLGSTLLVDQFPGADFGGKLQACLGAVNATYGGTCDARNFTGSQSMGSNLTVSTGNATVLLPCATISTANQIIVRAGTRNVTLRGCALRGGSAASGSQGGTAFAYSGAGAMVQLGDPTYAVDTPGFHLDNVVINTTAATSANAKGLIAYRTQEMDLESLYLLGNGNQTGITLDGTGNYTGGTFLDDQIDGFQTALNAIGHQVANPATTDWMNASVFVRLHIDCPTSGGSPVSGTIGINLQQGDGNTFTGGDVEGCSTALHLGLNAQNNTIVGLRNENSTNQVVADAGSSYNNWMTGGTMFTGQLTDNGTRNSFLDTFHRSFNGINGDWYGSQQDATVTNHFRLGIGAGNERGLENRYQTDFGYRWTMGLSDATGGEQFYQILDELNSVYRLEIGQYNNGQSSTNNQTVINAAGTGAIVLNGSNNAGTGGVVIGSGGASESTVAAISNAGNAQFNGTMLVGGTSQSAGTMTVRNNADTEVDYYLWPGLTTSQKGSFTYKDWNGNSQWYLLKDASNNWAVNSAIGGLDSFKAYQSTNSGDTYIDASNSTGHIRLNYETGSGAETDIYSGSSSSLDAAFLGPTSIKFPGLAAGSGYYCLQVDTSGYITNTGTACGSGGGGGTTGTVNSGSTGSIAYYTTSGTVIGGEATVPVTAGGTGAATAAAAVANLLPGVASNGSNGVTVSGNVGAAATTAKMIGGSEYASQYQTGSGNNGIANASSGATGQTVIADPSYATTELPTTTSFSASSLHYQDLRKGSTVDYYHNPALYLWNWPYYGWLGQTGDTKACLFDGLQYAGAVTEIGCQNLEFASTAPGWSIGNPPVTGGGSGWLSGGDLAIVDHSNSAGIFQAIGINHSKYGVGDNVGVYATINSSHNGWIAASDEGTKAIAGKVLEDPNTYIGTITSGASTGSTSIKTTAVTDGGSQGVGMYLIDTTQAPVTGTYTAVGNGILGGSSVTVNVTGGTVTASRAWGTLTANAATPLNTTPPFSTSETITVSVTSGTFSSSTSVPYCFAGTFHETAFATAVSTTGGVATITIPLRRPHASGTYVFQGGMCGYGFEETAFDQTPNGQTLRYLFDVVGSESSTNLQVVQYEPGGAVGAPLHAFTYQTVNLASGVTNGGSGTTVSFTNAGGGTLFSPTQYVGSTFTFSGLSDSALNAACAGVVWTSSSTGACTIAGLSGSHTSTTTGTASPALNQFALRPMAEILDVQNETLSPPQVDGTLALEPNVIPFGNGDTVESPHHVSALMQGQSLAKVNYNPYEFGGLVGANWQGAGANGGSNIPSSTAILNLANQTADSTYQENGGFLPPPNYFSMLGSYYNGLITDHAPGKNAAFLNINPTSTQVLDASYCSSVWAESSYSSFQICPYNGNATLNTAGMQTYSATSHRFIGAVNGVNGFQVSGNTVLPTTLTGYHGNGSGIKVALATNWTNTAGALLCDDGNGNLTITACTVNATQVNGAAVSTSKTIVGTNSSGQIIDASSTTLANNTSGTAANITAISNSTLTTLSALSLPIGQVTGTINATQINGASVSASAAVLSSNSSGQLAASTPHQVMLPIQCADTSSSSTTYACTTTPSLASLTKGDTFRFTSVNQNNSGSSTLNIDGIGAVTIRKWQNTASLASGDLQANAAVSLTYDGTYLELDTIGNAPLAAIPLQYKTWSVQDGVVGTAVLPTSGFPAVGIGYNATGATETITAIRCYVDGGSSTTVIFSDGSGNNLLSGTSLTCSSSWASGSLSTATTTIASGGYIKWTPTPDGTAKEITVVISGTY